MSLMRTLTSGAAATTIALIAGADTALIAPHVVMPNGELAADRAVIIAEDGTIRDVVAVDDVPGDATIIRYEHGVISPGLIDVNSAVGVSGANFERAYAIDAEASALESFDPGAFDVSRAHQAGVTAVMVMPAPVNVIPGRAATVRTWSADGTADVIWDDTALSVVIAPSAYSPNREPSTRSGALQMLRATLRDDQASGSLQRALEGNLPILVTCAEAQDVFAALTLFGTRSIVPTIVHTIDAGEIAEDIAEQNATVVVGPYGFESDEKTLSGAGALERAGASVVLAGNVGSGDPDSLRITAALAVRHGLSPATARRAITSSAAAVSRVADRTGAIQAGLDADLVVFSGDPLRLDARVVEVWVKGSRSFTAESAQYNHDKVIGATHD